MKTLSILCEITSVLMLIGTVSGIIMGDGQVAVMCLVSCGAFLFVHKLITKIQ